MQMLFERIYSGQHLTAQQAAQAVNKMFVGELTEAQISAFLVALKIKGEQPDEIAGAAMAMREQAVAFTRPEGLVADCCGTGGDGMRTLNISTLAALTASAAGVPVAKHGNRRISSSCGSSDLLTMLGLPMKLSPAMASQLLSQHQFCFLYAPQFHQGLRHAMPVRQQLATRTLFNLLGPLVNPARPNVQLMGVYQESLCEPIAHALHQLGVERALVVHGAGLDELALHGPTTGALLDNGLVESFTLQPVEAGLPQTDLSRLQCDTAEDSAAAGLCVLKGIGSVAHRHAVALNVGALLWLCERASDIRSGTQFALELIESGAVMEHFERIIRVSRMEASRVESE